MQRVNVGLNLLTENEFALESFGGGVWDAVYWVLGNSLQLIWNSPRTLLAVGEEEQHVANPKFCAHTIHLKIEWVGRMRWVIENNLTDRIIRRIATHIIAISGNVVGDVDAVQTKR